MTAHSDKKKAPANYSRESSFICRIDIDYLDAGFLLNRPATLINQTDATSFNLPDYTKVLVGTPDMAKLVDVDGLLFPTFAVSDFP